MTEFLLIRHGETAWHLPKAKGAIGWGVDIAPLTENGICQVKGLIPQVREWSPECFITSPTSRTLHTCALLSAALDLPFEVEFDLHEWIPDDRMDWDSLDKVKAASEEMEILGGEWPEEGPRNWEPLSNIRRRCSAVFKKHLNRSKVL